MPPYFQATQGRARCTEEIPLQLPGPERERGGEIGSKEGDTFAEEAKSSIFVQLPKFNRQRKGGYRREGAFPISLQGTKQ